MKDKNVIDAHVHCGEIDRSVPQTFEDYENQAAGSEIDGAAVFSPVLEIYDRYDTDFTDTPAWRLRRRESNAYLLGLESDELRKVYSLELDPEVEAAVLGVNFMRLQETRQSSLHS